MSLTEDLLFPSTAKGGLCMGNVLALDGFLYYRGMVPANLGYNPDVLKAGDRVIH